MYKFPHTPHLIHLHGDGFRGDKVLSASGRDFLLSHEISVEEKIDGANLGIGFDSDGNLFLQNRGKYIDIHSGGQWKPLHRWLEPKTDILFDVLSNRLILFGEWCYARHTVFYSRLPDWFVCFDVFDTASKKFWSLEKRNDLCADASISIVPWIATGVFQLHELMDFIRQSKYGEQPMEGIYIRHDANGWLDQRAKLVRSGFLQPTDEHWSAGSIIPNTLERS